MEYEIILCPYDKSGVMHYPKRATSAMRGKCKRCGRVLSYTPGKGVTVVDNERDTASGCRIW